MFILKKKKYFFLNILALLVFAGCRQDYGLGIYIPPPPPEVDPRLVEKIHKFTIGGEKLVDIVVVVDNSRSMVDEQAALANAFSAYIQNFVTQDVKFNIGITSTDMGDTNIASLETMGLISAGPGSFVRTTNQPNVLQNSTPNLGQLFTSYTNMSCALDREDCIAASGAEAPIAAAMAALSPSMLSGANSGFFRSSAALALVLVSDEDETLPSPLGYLTTQGQQATDDYINAAKNQLIALKDGRPGLITAAAITNLGPDNCPLKFRDGLALMQFASALFGSSMSICGSWATNLSNLSASIAAQIGNSFALTGSTAIEGSLEVTVIAAVTGVRTSLSSPADYSYDPNLNSVTLSASAMALYNGNPDPVTNPTGIKNQLEVKYMAVMP